MQNSVAKKIFAVGSAVAMTLSLAVPFVASAAVHADGTNVDKSGTVGMIVSGQFRPYTSAGAFLSYGFNSWASVVTANAEDMSLPTGSFIPPQDGKIFCAEVTKDSDVKGECSLITGGQKAAFTSAAVFTGLGFSFSKAVYGDSSFMSKTTNIDNTTAAHRPGVLVNNNGTVQLVGSTGLLGIPDLATFNSWGYSFANVVPANAADKTMTQTGVMAARVAGQLSPTALVPCTSNCGAPVVSGSVSAMLASDSPAASTIVKGAAAVNMAKYVFNGTGTITSFTLKRFGVSADTVLKNVYLYEGNTRLTDAASVGGSSTVTFANASGLFTVSGSKTITVVAEIDNSSETTSGQTVGVQLTGYAVASGSPTSVTISGNVMTVSSVTLSTVDFGTISPANSSFDPAKDTEVFKSMVSIGTRDVTLSRLAIRQIGSVNNSDLNNFRLRIDGNQVAQVQNLSADGYAYFSFSPVTLKSGTRTFSVLADIVGGSSRYFHFQVRNKVDADFTDSNYGAVVAATYSSGNFPATVSTGTYNGDNAINSGNLTFQKTSDSPSGDVIKDSSDVTLAKYTVTAYGEAVKIETLVAGITSSTGTVANLRNGKILVNGAQYGSNANLATLASGGTSYTLNYTVQPGTPVAIEIHADMYDNDGTNNLAALQTIKASIKQGSSNAQKMTSLGYIGVPSSDIDGNSMNIVTGSMSMASQTNYTGQTVPLPQTAYKVAAFNLVGSSSEDIDLNSVEVSVTAGSANADKFDYGALTDIMVKVNGNMFGTVKSTLSSGTNTFSGTFKLSKNATAVVEVYASLKTSNAAGTAIGTSEYMNAKATVYGTTSSSGVSVNTGLQTGQTITYNAGSLVTAVDPSTPVAFITSGGQTKTVASYKFTSSNDAYTITELTATTSGATTINSFILKAADGSDVATGGVKSVSKPGMTTVTFSGLSIVVPSNSTKVVTVDLQLGTVGYAAGTSGENVRVTMTGYKVNNSSGVQTTQADESSFTARIAKEVRVLKAVPTLTNIALPQSTLVAGDNTVSKFSISTGGTGTIAWNTIVFTVNKTAAESIATGTSATTLYDADSGQAVSGVACTATNLGTGYTSGTVTCVSATSDQEVSGAKNYYLKANVTGTLSTNDYISTKIANPSNTSFLGPVASNAGALSGASFIWSDESAQSHVYTSSDYFSDYLVKNLPTDSQTLTK